MKRVKTALLCGAFLLAGPLVRATHPNPEPLPLATKAVLSSLVAGGAWYGLMEWLLQRSPADAARRAKLLRLQKIGQYLIIGGAGAGLALLAHAYIQERAAERLSAKPVALAREEWRKACVSVAALGSGMSDEEAARYAQLDLAGRTAYLKGLANDNRLQAYVDAATFSGNKDNRVITRARLKQAIRILHSDRKGELVDKQADAAMFTKLSELNNLLDGKTETKAEAVCNGRELVYGTFDSPEYHAAVKQENL